MTDTNNLNVFKSNWRDVEKMLMSETAALLPLFVHNTFVCVYMHSVLANGGTCTNNGQQGL